MLWPCAAFVVQRDPHVDSRLKLISPTNGRPRAHSARADISRRGLLKLALGAAASFPWTGCNDRDARIRIDSSRRTSDPLDASTDLHLAIGTRITPAETLRSFGQLAGYLGQRIGRRVVILQRRSYAETNELLLGGQADFAFICSGAYAAIRDKGVVILAVPVVGGKSLYRSLILVRSDDRASGFEDLRGSSFAFVDLLSLTGKMYPELLASRLKLDAGPFFGDKLYTHSHSDSIDMVAQGKVRAAGVDSLVFERLKVTEPARTRGLRILLQSEPFGIPPFVARAGLEPGMLDAIRRSLFSLNDSPQGAEILQSLGFDRLSAGDESMYVGVSNLVAELGAVGARP